MIRQKGFSILTAIFVLIVLSMLGGYMARLSGVQHFSTNYVVQGARAYQAANAGIEWALGKSADGGSCNGQIDKKTLVFDGLDDFEVTLSCDAYSSTEANEDVVVYAITALSESGDFDSPFYVSRKIQMSTVAD
jgi:MSHA biogenesis protein MshP